jgi:hypothetical protein
MHILIFIPGFIVGLVLVLLLAAAFSGDDYSIEAYIFINKPQAEVLGYVKYLKNHENYNKWVMTDPNVRKRFEGTDGTVGFHYYWDSDNKQVGQGEQIITGLTDTRVDYELIFIKPFSARAGSYIDTAAVADDQTKVTWGFHGKRAFVMKVMHIALNLKKALAKDLQTSLQNLKTLLEKA